MIIYDHKKALATMMAKRDPKYGSKSVAPLKPEIAKNEDGSVDGRHAAAEDMLMAIHEKSAHKLKEAMANFHDLHMGMNSENPEAES